MHAGLQPSAAPGLASGLIAAQLAAAPPHLPDATDVSLNAAPLVRTPCGRPFGLLLSPHVAAASCTCLTPIITA